MVKSSVMEFSLALSRDKNFELNEKLQCIISNEFCLKRYSHFFKHITSEQYKKAVDEKNIILKMKHLKEIEFHKHVADRQRKTYNRYRTDPDFLGNDSILIDVDWKEKISYGKNSPRQLNTDWYSAGICSLLSFGVYFVDQKLNKLTGLNEKFVNCMHIDVLSDETTQTATRYTRIFRYVRQLEKFRKVEKPNYIIFSDTARQFRCDELCHFYLEELKNEGIRVSFNYFGECHGKVSFFFCS